MSNQKPIRAFALPDNDIGQQRHKLFKFVLSRINQARQDGYYLEAIALLESLISDRLESYLGSMNENNIDFKTLGSLINDFKNKANQDKIDHNLKEIVLNEVDDWRERRNTALHEMAKINLYNQQTWQQKYQNLDAVVDNGLDIFRKIDRRLSALRKA